MKSKTYKDEDPLVEVPVWWSTGSGMMYRRDCLEPEHPESSYSYFVRNYPDLNPGDYGIEGPSKCCPTCGRGDSYER